MIGTEKVRDEKFIKAREKLRASYTKIYNEKKNNSIILIIEPQKKKYKSSNYIIKKNKH